MNISSTPSLRFFEHVGSILRAQANEATEWHNSSQEELQRVCSKPNGGTPEEVLQATNNLNLAVEALVLAHVQFNGFIISRKIPEELCLQG
jgi:hypothetical protein